MNKIHISENICILSSSKWWGIYCSRINEWPKWLWYLDKGDKGRSLWGDIWAQIWKKSRNKAMQTLTEGSSRQRESVEAWEGRTCSVFGAAMGT